MASHIQLWDQDLQSRAIVAYSVLKRLQLQTPKGAKKSTLAPNVPLVRHNDTTGGLPVEKQTCHSIMFPWFCQESWNLTGTHNSGGRLYSKAEWCQLKFIDSRTKFWNANTMKCFPSTLFFDPRVWLNRGQLHCKRRGPKLRTGSRRHAFVWSTKNIKKL